MRFNWLKDWNKYLKVLFEMKNILLSKKEKKRKELNK